VVSLLILAGIFIGINADLSPESGRCSCHTVFSLFLLFPGEFLSQPAWGWYALSGFWMLKGGASALGIAGSTPFSSVGQYTMTVMPLFIIRGSFAALAGFAEEGFNLAKKWMEDIPRRYHPRTIIGATRFRRCQRLRGAATCAILAKSSHS